MYNNHVKIEKPSFIKDSHTICVKSGINPGDYPQFIQLTNMEIHKREVEYEKILEITNPFINTLIDSLRDSAVPLLVAICDNEAAILQIEGDPTMQEVMDTVGFKAGVKFTEECTGTNVVNLALKLKKSIKLIGDDHYHKLFHTAACYAVPFRSQDKQIIGVVNFMTDSQWDNPFLMGMLEMCVSSIEREIMLYKQNMELDLLNKVLMDSRKNGIIITDQRGFVKQVNQVADEHFLKMGYNLYDFNIFDVPHIGPFFHEALNNQMRYDEVLFKYNKEGKEMNIVGDIYPLINDHNILLGTVGQFREVAKNSKNILKHD